MPASLAGPSGSTCVTTTPFVSSRPSCSATGSVMSCTERPKDFAVPGSDGVAEVRCSSGSSSSAIFGCSVTFLPSRITLMSTFLSIGVDATTRVGVSVTSQRSICCQNISCDLSSSGISICQPALPSLVTQWFRRRVGLATACYSNGLLAGEMIAAGLMPIRPRIRFAERSRNQIKG